MQKEVFRLVVLPCVDLCSSNCFHVRSAVYVRSAVNVCKAVIFADCEFYIDSQKAIMNCVDMQLYLHYVEITTCSTACYVIMEY